MPAKVNNVIAVFIMSEMVMIALECKLSVQMGC